MIRVSVPSAAQQHKRYQKIQWPRLYGAWPCTSDDHDLVQACDEYFPTARSFLDSLNWHNGVVGNYFGGGQIGIGCAYLFEVVSRNPSVDRFVWVVAGHLPAIYMPVDDILNWVDAFDSYCGAAEDWINAESAGISNATLYPFDKTLRACSNQKLKLFVADIENVIIKPNSNLLS